MRRIVSAIAAAQNGGGTAGAAAAVRQPKCRRASLRLAAAAAHALNFGVEQGRA
jgi:hypothetical protein